MFKHRALSTVGALLAAGSLVLSACQSTPSASPGTGNQSNNQQSLTWATSALLPTLHPFVSIGSTQRRYDIYDTLIGQKADGSVMPSVAAEWKSLDDTTWQLTLRTDMKFSDGTPVTAEDVKFSIERAIDPSKKYAILSRVQTIQSAEVVDDHTVKVTTAQPDGLFLKRLAMISVLPEHVLNAMGDDQFGLHPVGSGPYKVVSFKPEDTLVLAANNDHPFRKPTIQNIAIRDITEASSRSAGLRTGELDFIDYVPIDQVDQLKSAGFKLNIITSGQSTGYWIDTVVGDQPVTGPTGDKRVRQALNYAINKDSINQAIYKGLTQPEQGQPIQPQTFGFDPSLKPYPYDPAKAKQLLAEAGYADGINLTLEFLKADPETEQTALLIQQQARDVGINITVNTITDYATFRDKFYGVQQRADLFRPGLLNSPAMDADFALVWFAGTQPGGTRHFNNPDFDKYYLPTQTELDQAKRAEDFHKALAVLREEAPYLFLLQNVRIQAYKEGLQGIQPRTDYEPEQSQLSWAG